MNSYRRSRRLIPLVQLLAIISTTSAVSLQDFQFITIIQVPSLSCLAAYGRTISGCSRSDFKDGVQCSQTCAEGVQEDQTRVVEACKHLDVNDRSLLGLALQGGLVDALCPNFQVTTVTSTVNPSTTRTFLTPSQTQDASTTITSTSESSSTITSSASDDNTESSTTTEAIATTSDNESATSTTETTSEVDTTIASATPTETESTTTISSSSTPSPTQTNDEDDGDDDEDDSPDKGRTGGGSPFDPVFVGGAERRISRASFSMLASLTGSIIAAVLWL